jgi:hypothetical protein
VRADWARRKELGHAREEGEEKENGPRGGTGPHSEGRKEEGDVPAGLGCKGKRKEKKKKEKWAGPN